MSDFWTNVSRYPRFFISSFVGLILIILAPFRNLFKVKKFRFILPFLVFLVLGVFYAIISNMTGL